MNQLIDKWREVALDGNSLKLREDNLPESKYSTYTEFINSEDFGKASFDFHLGLIPQPYIGDLASAKVFLLMLNPGFSPGDYYAQEQSTTFRQARIDNLKQKNGADDYPFFYLNPEFAWTAGGQWWQNKLASIAKRLENDNGLSYKKALQHISKSLACIELCPYFSKIYKEPKPRLKSMNLADEYVKDTLLKQCVSGEASAVLLRQVRLWGLTESENIFCLDPKQARGAHLTTGAEAEPKTDSGYFKKAGDFMYDKLAALLP